MKNEAILKTNRLKKYFGPVHAVEDVSLEVRPGEVYGFLGPNGAGKTTTIGMILSLIHPTAGSVHLFGEEVTPGRNQALRRVGALVGSPAIIPYLSARQNLELVARLHTGVTAKRIDETLAMVSLEEASHRKAGSFSTGMKQRLGLAMALVHHPELLVLDEPTNGMDPAGMREVRVLLRELASKGVTVFLSSHLLHEIEQVCDRVAVLNRGRVITQGPVIELLGDSQIVRVKVSDTATAASLLKQLPQVQQVTLNGSYVTVSGASSERVVAHLAANGVALSEVSSGRADLESLFLELTGAGQNER